MKETFDMFDYDKDGTISLDELQTVMASCGVYVTEVRGQSKFMGYMGRDHQQGAKRFF